MDLPAVDCISSIHLPFTGMLKSLNSVKKHLILNDLLGLNCYQYMYFFIFSEKPLLLDKTPSKKTVQGESLNHFIYVCRK